MLMGSPSPWIYDVFPFIELFFNLVQQCFVVFRGKICISFVKFILIILFFWMKEMAFFSLFSDRSLQSIEMQLIFVC